MRVSLVAVAALTLLLLSPVILFKPSALLSSYQVKLESYQYPVNVEVVGSYFPPIVYPGAFAQITLHNNENYSVVVYYVKVNGVTEQTIPSTPVVIPPHGNVTIQVQVSVVASNYEIVVVI